MNKDTLADKVIHARQDLTYSEVHTHNWTDEDRCRAYVMNRFGYELRKAGITRRTNKLWKAASNALRVRPNVQIEDSLWKITWAVDGAIRQGLMPSLANTHHYLGHLFESPETMSTLGYVSAPDEQSARMAASVTLGPRVHSECIVVTRSGIGGWENAKNKNALVLGKYKKLVEHAKRSLLQKQWELEQIECQIAFLEVEATFDSPVTV